MGDLLWARCRGRNGWESPIDIAEDMAAEARNWSFYEGALGAKRGGSTMVSVSGLAEINALSRFVPAQDETAAEFFAVDNSATNQILRMAAGSTFAALTLKDNLTTANDTQISFVTVNGKHYIAYDSAVNRLHKFDPAVSTTIVQRVGHALPAAPSVANTGAGTYGAVLRYYRIQWRTKSGSTIKVQSNLGTAQSFTPSGAGTHARVTQPSAPGEGETHWAIYGSEDDALYYELAEVVIGTTTYDDNETPADYDVNEAAPAEGAFTPWPSVKYLATDGNRLLGFGVWETTAGDSLTPKAGRVFFSPVLDTTDTDDDERVSNTTEFEGWIDIARNSGSVDRGITPAPINGVFLVGQSRGIDMLVPTESAVAPYRRVRLSSQLGFVSHQSIVMAEDELGRPCAYFLDPELGPYRWGAGGLQRCGKDVQDIWDTVNHGATQVVAWGTYYKARNLVLFSVATGVVNNPDVMLAFDVTEGRFVQGDGVRGGWSVWDGDFANGRCGCMFASTLGASMGRNLVPYVGKADTTKLLRFNPSATQDDTTSFRGYVRSKAIEGSVLPRSKHVMRAYVLATTESGVTITQGLVRNFGDETTRTDTTLLTAAGSEARVLKRFESPDLVDAYVFQVELGDGAAQSSAFTLERWWAEIKEQDYKGN